MIQKLFISSNMMFIGLDVAEAHNSDRSNYVELCPAVQSKSMKKTLQVSHSPKHSALLKNGIQVAYLHLSRDSLDPAWDRPAPTQLLELEWSPLSQVYGYR